MSYSSDLKERRRRKRRQDARLLIYSLRSLVATAALVAIAFAFDVPEKIRARLWPPEVAAHEPRDVPEPPHPRAESRKRELESQTSDTDNFEPFDDPLRRPAATEEGFARGNDLPAPMGKDEIVIPGRAQQPAVEPTAKPPTTAQVEEEDPRGQLVVLKLDEKLMRIPLLDASEEADSKPRVRVIALRESEAKTELQPTDGVVGDDPVQIVFPDLPRVRILVRVDQIGQRIFLLVEPLMALWADQPMPYTLKKVKSEAHKTRQAADEFFFQLAAAEQEKATLEAWVKPGTGIKALADVQRANKRIAVLNVLIEQMNGQIDEVRQGVEQVAELERLAGLLHGKAELQFETVEAD